MNPAADFPALPGQAPRARREENSIPGNLPLHSKNDMELLVDLIEKTFPLAKRFRRNLPQDVARLSRLLSSERADREGNYLGRAALLQAYLRYFLPWNVYRLCLILPGLPLTLKEGDTLIDLGSGPLSFPIALWIARGEFRSLDLEFRCLDRNAQALDAGLALFRALAGQEAPWTIRTMRASVGARIPGKKAALVSAVQIYNEMFQHERRSVEAFAEKQAGILSALASGQGSILIVEPGTPQSGALTAAFRSALTGLGRVPLSPCPHAEACPFPGSSIGRGKNKWCHFAFGTDDAPKKLAGLSEAAGLPKDRAVVSFLYAGKKEKPSGVSCKEKTGNSRKETSSFPVRIISDSFALRSGGRGRYGCSGRGMVLIRGSARLMETCPSGSLVMAAPLVPPERDPKSGALVAELRRTEPVFRARD
jgi:hypothetical protein